MILQQRADFFLKKLAGLYPCPATHLDAKGAWELLVATVLAAQCTDERVNTVTPRLFARWPGPKELAETDCAALEEVIRPTGFYRSKAKNLAAAARRVMAAYDGKVPQSMDALITLGGVGRKTANVVLWGAFGKNEGIAVDTHVGRIAFRMGLTLHEDPLRVEKDLMTLFPQSEWGNANHRMVWFGRDVCRARKPRCGSCAMTVFCLKNGVSAE